MYHGSDSKVGVHAFYCLLALRLTALVRRELGRAALELSVAAILEQLRAI